MEIKLKKFLGIEFVEEEGKGCVWLIPNEMIILYNAESGIKITHIDFIKFISYNNFEIYIYEPNGSDKGYAHIIKNNIFKSYTKEFSFSEFKIFTSYVDYLKFKNKIELIR